jgi:anti-sigma B factor antagonist
MDEMTLRTSVSPSGVRIIVLTGPLTLNTLFEFQSEVRREASDSLVVDLTGVPYMDSAGLGSILGAFASCQRTRRGFAIAGICDRVRTLFQVANVDGLLPVFESAADAEAKVKSKQAGA